MKCSSFVQASAGALFVGALFPSLVSAQLRVATWNISNYGETTTVARDAAIQTAVFGSFNGRTMTPDAFMVQEVESAAAQTHLLSVLNASPGQTGAWAAAVFHDGPDSDSSFFYRTNKVNLLGAFVIANADPGTTGQPRDTMRYDVSLKGYTGTAPSLSMYSAHLKAGSTSTDNARRLVETQRIRDNAETLPAGRMFLMGGDFNVQSSTQTAYAELVGSQSNNTGRLYDPIKTPGDWNNNSAYRFVHTQDPTGSGGMDDRHDQILLGNGLIDGKGFDYIGNPNTPYATNTWDDPNHSYRAWGNDGTSFGGQLTTTGNAMVGSTIASAIKTVASSSGGHLGIFLDLRVAEELAKSTSSLNFGTVYQDSDASQSLGIFNDVDSTIWGTNGIANLDYSLVARGDVIVPSGLFSDAAGGSTNLHDITLNTDTPGSKSGFVDIYSNGALLSSVSVTGFVAVPEPGCIAVLVGGAMLLLGRGRKST